MMDYHSSGDQDEMSEDELHRPELHNGSEDSDEELRIAFKSGLLKPGLIAPMRKPRPAVDNVDGLLEKLEDIQQKDLEWLERLDVTVESKSEHLARNHDQEEEVLQNQPDKVHNDFKRELMFLNQAKEAVLKAMPLLRKAAIATSRPEDYFAEMAKKDDHMKKVREKLLSLQRRSEAREKYRKQLKLKKYGKKVQQAVELERKKKKKGILDSVKKFRKGQKDNLDFLDDKDPMNKRPGRTSQMQKFGDQQRKKSRAFRNKKFGFGGKKKGLKTNTNKSTNDVSGFKQKKASQKNKRLGKSRRQKTKRTR